MLTRCPSCQTVFRLRPEQLRARHGEVRCGHCFNPFNALEHLLESRGDGPSANAPVAPPATDGSSQPTAATIEPAAGLPPPAAPSGSADLPASTPPEPLPARPSFSDLEFDIPDSVPTVELTLDHDDVPAFGPSAVASFSQTPGALSGRLEPSTSPQAPNAEPAIAPALGATGAGDLPETGPRVDFSAMVMAAGNRLGAANAVEAPVFAHDEPARPASAPAPDIRIEPQDAAQPPESAAATAAPDDTESRADTGHLDATYGPPPAHGQTHSALFSVGMIVLVLGLALQSAYFFRESIARQLPGLRPLYVAVCTQLGCDMPLPRDAMLINIDSPDLQSEPGRPGRYILHATIQNRADYPQAWPHLELTLTDANDTPLVRRVLAPADWVATDKRQGEFKARSDATVRLTFDAPDIAPTGYRVYVFYP